MAIYPSFTRLGADIFQCQVDVQYAEYMLLICSFNNAVWWNILIGSCDWSILTVLCTDE